MTTIESETLAEPLIDEAMLDRLMDQVESEGLELLGPDGVLTDLTSRIMNRAMEAEMTEHLGYEKGDPAGEGSGNHDIAMGIDLDGCRHVLGLWFGNGDEGAKYWLSVLTELRNRSGARCVDCLL